MVVALCGALLCGCGPQAGLWVRIEAPLRVPEQADALAVKVTLPSGTLALERRFALSEAHSFPLTLAVYEEREEVVLAGEPLRVEAEALRGELRATPWAVGAASGTLVKGELVEVLVRLCDCADGSSE